MIENFQKKTHGGCSSRGKLSLGDAVLKIFKKRRTVDAVSGESCPWGMLSYGGCFFLWLIICTYISYGFSRKFAVGFRVYLLKQGPDPITEV